MQRHFLQELETLKTNLIKMASFAEDAIAEAIRAVLEHNKELAESVIAKEQRINSLEIEIDDAVIDLLALQQPVATDLRFIIAASKINNDLERIGDHAVNIAQSAIKCAESATLQPLPHIPKMAEITQTMLRNAIDAFIRLDTALAHQVLKSDDLIDDLNKKIVADLVEVMQRDIPRINEALELIRVSRNLERVADLATNIAEEVIFTAEARVVKHRAPDRQ
ncbi:MAG: phosphate transport system regulatory protein PhoU [Ignavibacteria bacterium]